MGLKDAWIDWFVSHADNPTNEPPKEEPETSSLWTPQTVEDGLVAVHNPGISRRHVLRGLAAAPIAMAVPSLASSDFGEVIDPAKEALATCRKAIATGQASTVVDGVQLVVYRVDHDARFYDEGWYDAS